MSHTEHFEEEREFSFKSLFVPLTTAKAITWIVVIGLIIYCNSLFNGFVGDDTTQILENPLVHSITNIPTIFLGSTFDFGGVTNSGLYYKPLMSLFVTIIYVSFGSNAWVFHLFQICLHIVNVILVFLIFRYFFNKYISIFLSLVFLIHPINAETVVYISDLQDVLFFFFGSLALYLELRMKDGMKKNFWITLLLLLSIFSKETGVLFLVIILGYEFIFHRIKLKQTFMLACLSLGIYALFRIGFAHIIFYKDSASPIMNVSFAERLLNIPVILLYYFKTVFYPLHLAVAQEWIMSTKDILVVSLSAMLLLVVIIIILWLGKIIYSNHKKYFTYYIFFTFMLSSGLLFHSQLFFTLDSTVADRWFYFPLFGLLGIIGVLVEVYSKKLQFLSKTILIFFVLAILISLGVRSIIRNTNFHDDYTLASHDVRYSEDSSLLNSLLGAQLMDRGQYNEAEPYLLKAVKLDPKGQVVWNTLGLYYEAVGQPIKAQQAYMISITNGASLEAYYNLALCYFVNYQLQSAEKIAREGLHKFPFNGLLWQFYSLIENKLGHSEIALAAARNAAIYDPTPTTITTYNRLTQNLPVNTKIIPSSGKSKKLMICLPDCQ